MIKLIIICAKAIVITIAALLFASCNQNINFGNGLDGNGNVQIENRTPTAKFNKIESSRGLEISVEQSNTILVQVEADENLQKHIIIKVENETLIVTTDKDLNDAATKKVTIKMPIIVSLSADSGTAINTKNTIKGNSLTIHSDSGSILDVSAEYESITADCDSGSAIKIAGKTLKLIANSDSGSDFNATSLLANDVNAIADSGSSITVHPLVNLIANADSGASINYLGDPKTIKKTEDSGGSVQKK